MPNTDLPEELNQPADELPQDDQKLDRRTAIAQARAIRREAAVLHESEKAQAADAFASRVKLVISMRRFADGGRTAAMRVSHATVCCSGTSTSTSLPPPRISFSISSRILRVLPLQERPMTKCSIASPDGRNRT